MNIRDNFKTPLRVAIVDVTEDRDGFEHSTTRQLAAALAPDVTVITGCPVFSKDGLTGAVAELQALASRDFNVLVIVAHTNSQWVDAGSDDAPFYLLREVPMGVGDKLVCLAACEALGEATIDSFVREGDMALFLVASTVKVSPSDVLGFFPRLLRELNDYSAVHADVLRASVSKANSAAGTQFGFHTGA